MEASDIFKLNDDVDRIDSFIYYFTSSELYSIFGIQDATDAGVVWQIEICIGHLEHEEYSGWFRV